MERSLRFCMITTFYPPYNFGGDGIFVHRLSNELARRGHHVEVIHCQDAYKLLAGREPDTPYTDHPNVTVHGLRSPFGFLSPLATQQTGFPFFKATRIQQILEKGFDVIHYHNISLIGGPKILAYGSGIKLYTIHEYWLICPTHVLFRFNRTPCTKPYCFICSLIHKRPPQWWRYSKLLETTVKHVDTFIAPSRFLRDLHCQKGFQIPIVHLPNFVPCIEGMPPLYTSTACKPSAKPYFLFVGRLEKLKGLQTLIPVFCHYDRARLLIAGTGSYEPRLRQLTRGSNNVQFLGHVSIVQLQTLYQQAVAVIIPSTCFEIFPLVILETFREHTPVIVRNLGGMPELITESGAGYIYNTNEELVTFMDRLIADPTHRAELGERGYQAYLRHWTAEAHLQRYFALIEELAKKRQRESIDLNI